MSAVLTLAEAAEILRVRPRTMRLYARTGIVPATKVGKSWRFRATDLPCFTKEVEKQALTGGSDSRSRALRSGSRVAQIARTLRKRLNNP